MKYRSLKIAIFLQDEIKGILNVRNNYESAIYNVHIYVTQILISGLQISALHFERLIADNVTA